MYHYRCDGADNSADYMRDEIGAIVGHQNRTSLGFTGLEQRFISDTSPSDNEYCYADGTVARYNEPLCSPWSASGNGNCMPDYFVLSF